jgi:LAS superfamily LD-carboxypeptidase LdcB
MGGQPIERQSTRSLRRRVVAAIVLVAAVAAPDASDGAPAQEPSLEEQQQDVQERQGEVALEVDALEASNAEVQAALTALEANVATQQAALDAAAAAAAAADTALTEAETAVADAQAQVDVLNAATDDLVVQSYVQPPADNAWDTLSADSINDATVMQAVLDIQADSEADLLDLLEHARDDLSVQRDERATASADAEDAQAAAADALSQVQAARDQQVVFAAEAEAALDHKLTEAANLETLDADLSRQIAEEAAEQARLQAEQAAAAAAGPAPGAITDVSGDLSTVSCHGGGSITVADSLAPSLQQLLDAAAADGLQLCGGGWRDSQQQIQLRMEHCGTSYYAIYQMPASQCSPPTARPGTSQHEVGLAIDFVNCSSHSTACWQWLNEHAADYGLQNLASEPWHWSPSGR